MVLMRVQGWKLYSRVKKWSRCGVALLRLFQVRFKAVGLHSYTNIAARSHSLEAELRFTKVNASIRTAWLDLSHFITIRERWYSLGCESTTLTQDEHGIPCSSWTYVLELRLVLFNPASIALHAS